MAQEGSSPVRKSLVNVHVQRSTTGRTRNRHVLHDGYFPRENAICLKRLQCFCAGAWLGTMRHIVVDEVHERDFDADLLLVVLNRLLADRKAKGKPIKVTLITRGVTIDPILFQVRGIQVESTRVLRVRCLVVDISLLCPLHSLELPAGRADCTEWSHLVSQSVLSSDPSPRVPSKICTRNGCCCFRRGRWSSYSSRSPTSLWLHSEPLPSRTSCPFPIFVQPPDQTPRALQRRCMTYQSHSSIMPCSTIEGEDKKGILCVYCVSTTLSTQCDARKRTKTPEPKEGAPRWTISRGDIDRCTILIILSTACRSWKSLPLFLCQGSM